MNGDHFADCGPFVVEAPGGDAGCCDGCHFAVLTDAGVHVAEEVQAGKLRDIEAVGVTGHDKVAAEIGHAAEMLRTVGQHKDRLVRVGTALIKQCIDGFCAVRGVHASDELNVIADDRHLIFQHGHAHFAHLLRSPVIDGAVVVAVDIKYAVFWTADLTEHARECGDVGTAGRLIERVACDKQDVGIRIADQGYEIVVYVIACGRTRVNVGDKADIKFLFFRRRVHGHVVARVMQYVYVEVPREKDRKGDDYEHYGVKALVGQSSPCPGTDLLSGPVHNEHIGPAGDHPDKEEDREQGHRYIVHAADTRDRVSDSVVRNAPEHGEHHDNGRKSHRMPHGHYGDKDLIPEPGLRIVEKDEDRHGDIAESRNDKPV